MSRPHVPANIAEVLYVSLRSVLDHIEEHGTYPAHLVSDMRKVLKGYDRERTKALNEQKISQEAIRRYTSGAALALTHWQAKQTAKVQEAQAQDHFDRWKEELSSGE